MIQVRNKNFMNSRTIKANHGVNNNSKRISNNGYELLFRPKIASKYTNSELLKLLSLSHLSYEDDVLIAYNNEHVWFSLDSHACMPFFSEESEFFNKYYFTAIIKIDGKYYHMILDFYMALMTDDTLRYIYKIIKEFSSFKIRVHLDVFLSLCFNFNS